MSYYLQLIGSFIIGGMVLLLIFGLNFGINSVSSATNMDAVTQSQLNSIVETIDQDFSLIGYRVPPTSSSVVSFDSDSLGITFRADINSDNAVETIHYYYDPSGVSDTKNPNDFELIREVDGISAKIGTVTRFRVYGYNQRGFYTQVPGNVRKIRYEIAVESPYPLYDKLSDTTRYSGAFVTRLIQPSN